MGCGAGSTAKAVIAVILGGRPGIRTECTEVYCRKAIAGLGFFHVIVVHIGHRNEVIAGAGSGQVALFVHIDVAICRSAAVQNALHPKRIVEGAPKRRIFRIAKICAPGSVGGHYKSAFCTVGGVVAHTLHQRVGISFEHQSFV